MIDNKLIRPMLSATLKDPEKLQFPCYASTKIDGVRFTIRNNQAISRSGKLLPNKQIQEYVLWLGDAGEGLDGELVVGDPYGKDVYKRSHSGVMTMTGMPNFKFYVFDDVTLADSSFIDRHANLLLRCKHIKLGARIEHLSQKLITTTEELWAYEAECLAKGYEGIILRHPHMPYKNGRSTINQFGMVKVKRFEDSEAVVIGFEELYHNANPSEVSELGYTVHSSHLANQVPMNKLGALICATLYDLEVGTPGETHIISHSTEFKIGTGFSDADRIELWAKREQLLDLKHIVKFKFLAIGSDEKPRHPVMLGWRSPDD